MLGDPADRRDLDRRDLCERVRMRSLQHRSTCWRQGTLKDGLIVGGRSGKVGGIVSEVYSTGTSISATNCDLRAWLPAVIRVPSSKSALYGLISSMAIRA